MVQYSIQRVDGKISDLATKTITAVFLIGFDGDKILACCNERGWDIPGGHVEPGETLDAALRREVLEETGATFGQAKPFALLTPQGADRSMLFYTTDQQLSCGTFTPSPDALDRALLPADDLLSRYHGEKSLLERLITEARQALTEQAAV